MLERYSSEFFRNLWSEDKKYQTWFTVELTAFKVLAKYKIIEPNDHDGFLTAASSIIFEKEKIKEIEEVCRHDVIAFLTYLEKSIDHDNARWLHYGMTSSDILDTSFSLLLNEAGEKIRLSLAGLIEELSRLSYLHKDTVMMGRSHGQHAEPTTFGLMLAGHVAEFQRAHTRLCNAVYQIRFGKISGAVGTNVHIPPEVEREILSELKLSREPVSTQVVPRDRYAGFFSALSFITAAAEHLAINIRHLSRTEVGEVAEGFSSGQKGSSAMPHKRNPIASENISGLARMVRSMVAPAMENISLWHERDISHSSAERMIAPDSTSLTDYILNRTTKMIENIQVFPEKMTENLNTSKNLHCSEAVLLMLIKKGMKRQAAYEIVQAAAFKVLEGGDFKELLRSHLTDKELEECFSLSEHIKNTKYLINQVVYGKGY